MLPGNVLPLCYPVAVALETVDPDQGPEPTSGLLPLPPTLRLLRSSIDSPDGATLVDDGLSVRIFFGVSSSRCASLVSEPWAAPGVDLRACPWDAVPRADEPWVRAVEALVAQRRLAAPAIFKVFFF